MLCNCALLSEGADFPECETLILLRPTKSKVRYVQMFGRVLRTSPGKKRAKVLDHSGSVKRLGFPWDIPVGRLDDGKPKKSQGQEAEKHESLPRPCPKCAFMKPAGVSKCPDCEFQPSRPNKVEAIDGELVQIRGKAPTAQKWLQAQGRASIFAQLCQMAQDRRKGESWVKAQYKAIYGSWPRQEAAMEPPTQELLSWIQYRNIQWAKSKGSR